MDDYTDDGLHENDPYNDMESERRRSIMPDFLALGALAAADREKGSKDGDENGGSGRTDGGDGLAEGRGSAARDLRNAEQGAMRSSGGSLPKGVAGAAKNETGAMPASGLYTGMGRPMGSNGNGDVKGKIKKYGPLGLIAALIIGVGGLMLGAQALMPVAIAEMIIDRFNSIGVSSTMSSDTWLDAQLNYGVTQQYVATEEKGNLFRFSDEQKAEFRKQNILVVDNVGAGGVTSITALLYFKNDTNTWVPVVGSDMLQYNGYSEADLTNAIKGASGRDNVTAPIGVAAAMKDKDFKVPYTTASKTWRGGTSGWFDTLMSDITEIKLNVRRNRWAGFLAKSLTQANAQFKEWAKSTALEQTNSGGLTGREETELRDEHGDLITDDDGNVLTGDSRYEDSDTITSGSSESQVEAILRSKAMQAAAAAAAVTDMTCATVNGLVTIYTLVSAYQSLQFINLISGFLESVDKVKAGYGDESPVNEYSTNLVTVGDTVKVEQQTGNETVVARKTAMESAGMAQLFTPSATISPSDASVQNVNIENIISRLTVFGGSMSTLTSISSACRVASVGTAAFGLATSIISFIPLFGQGVKIADVLLKKLGGIAVQGLAMLAIAAIVPVATKAIVKMITKNAATEWFGEDLGNAIISGANKYLGGNGSTGAQSPTGETVLTNFAVARNNVIAQEAEYQRATRSPLDTTSKYTFLGNITYKLMPLAYSGGAVGVLSGISSLTGASLISLNPIASATSDEEVLNSRGNCDILESVGGVGDAFCNAYIVTDVSTIETDPVVTFRNAYYAVGHYEYWDYDIFGNLSLINSNVSYTAAMDGFGNIIWPSLSTWDTATGKMIKHGPASQGGDGLPGYNFVSKSFNEEGTNVKKESDLAKYIVYCGERTSQYGIQDGSIAERISGGGGTARSILGMIPVIGDLMSLQSAIEQQANDEFISGQACVANSSPEYNPKWDTEYKYFQRYVENERLLENMYDNYTSPVSKTFALYHGENPIDTSFEGTLARFSGMTVEEVDYGLALLEYYEYVANYDAGERYAFGAPTIVEDDAVFYESNSVIATEYVVLVNVITYADIRNRVNLV